MVPGDGEVRGDGSWRLPPERLSPTDRAALLNSALPIRTAHPGWPCRTAIWRRSPGIRLTLDFKRLSVAQGPQRARAEGTTKLASLDQANGARADAQTSGSDSRHQPTPLEDWAGQAATK